MATAGNKDVLFDFGFLLPLVALHGHKIWRKSRGNSMRKQFPSLLLFQMMRV